MQSLDPLAVEICELRMELRCRWRGVPDLCHQSFLADLEGKQFILRGGCTQTVLDRLDDRSDLPLNPREFVVPPRPVAISDCPQSVYFALIFSGELLEQLRTPSGES